MTIVAQKTFEFEGRSYDVRVQSDGNEYTVAVFVGDDRANGYTYTASIVTDTNMKITHGVHAYEHLMDVAESDVREKYWERYIKAVQDLKAAGKTLP